MKLGFVSAILGELNLAEVLHFAAAEKYSCVEIMCWPMGKGDRRFAGVTHIDVEGMTSARADDIRALCQKTGVSISALGYYPNVLDPDPHVSEFAVGHLKKVIAAAKVLGLKTVNSFIGRDWKKTVEDNWSEFLRIWRPLIALAEDHDIRIGIENCPMSFSKDEWPGGKIS